MSQAQTKVAEGPFVGSRCVARPGGPYWSPGTIRRVNEDGTFSVELDRKRFPDLVMIPWCGVTPAEVSFNDVGSWRTAITRLPGSPPFLDLAGFSAVLWALGSVQPPEAIKASWCKACLELFGATGDVAQKLELDPVQAAALCIAGGISGSAADEALANGGPVTTWHKFYFNLTRMGGRDPGEIARTVTVEDALNAVGIGETGSDDQVVGLIRQLESRHGIRIPASLVTLLSRRGVATGYGRVHPNNPVLVYFIEQDGWELQRGLSAGGFDGDLGLVLLENYATGACWRAVFNSGDDDARVYFDSGTGIANGPQDPWRPVAPTIGMFFWDLAQTGLAWHLEHGRDSPRPIIRTDIGLAIG